MNSNQKRNKTTQTPPLRHIAAVLIIITTLSTIAYTTTAHSPSTLTVAYNIQTQELLATITHQVANPATHYIQKIEIKKNGIAYNTTLYTEQPDPNSFAYSYPVNASVGDTLEVTISCNQGGSKTIQHTVTQQTTNDNGKDSSTPGFELLIVLGALMSTVIIIRKKTH